MASLVIRHVHLQRPLTPSQTSLQRWDEDSTDVSCAPPLPPCHLFSGGPASSTNTARTENMSDIRHIFDGASSAVCFDSATGPRDKAFSCASSKAPLKHRLLRRVSRKFSRSSLFSHASRISSKRRPRIRFFRKLSRSFSHSRFNPIRRRRKASGDSELYTKKARIRKDLLSDESPGAGGYDKDAEILADTAVNASVISGTIPQLPQIKPRRDRRTDISSIDWRRPSPRSKPEEKPRPLRSSTSAPHIPTWGRAAPGLAIKHLLTGSRDDCLPTPSRQVWESGSSSHLIFTDNRTPWEFPIPQYHCDSLKESTVNDEKHDFASIDRLIEERLGHLEECELGTAAPETPLKTPSKSCNISSLDQEIPETPRGQDRRSNGPDPDQSPNSVHLQLMDISRRLRSTSLASTSTASGLGSNIPSFGQRLQAAHASIDRLESSPGQEQRKASPELLNVNNSPPSDANIRSKPSSTWSSKSPSSTSKVVSPTALDMDKTSVCVPEVIFGSTSQGTWDSHGQQGSHTIAELPITAARPHSSTNLATKADDLSCDSHTAFVESTPEIHSNSRNLHRHVNSNTTTIGENTLLLKPSEKSRKRSTASLRRMSSKVFTSLTSHHARSGSRSHGLPAAPDLIGNSEELSNLNHVGQHRNGGSIHAVEKHPVKSSDMWQRALTAHQTEKAALYLDVNKEQAKGRPRSRERSGSRSTLSEVSYQGHPDRLRKSPSCLPQQNSLMVNIKEEDPDLCPSAGKSYSQAWARYPSHNRAERNAIAGLPDRVVSRDFANEQVGSMHRIWMKEKPAEKKNWRNTSIMRLSRTKSLNLSSKFRSLRNYSDMFRSSSAEFRAYGHGHRSSTAASGQLKYPELEILPQILPLDQRISQESRRWTELFDHTRSQGANAQSHSTHLDLQHEPFLSQHDLTQDIESSDKRSFTPKESNAVPLESDVNLNGSLPHMDGARNCSHHREPSVEIPTSPQMPANLYQFSPERCNDRYRSVSMPVHGSSAMASLDGLRASMSLPARLKTGFLVDAGQSTLSIPIASVRESTQDLVRELEERMSKEIERVLSTADRAALGVSHNEQEDGIASRYS